jgi:hypothetical protein
MSVEKPVACTLTAADRNDRLAWIAELNAAALRDYWRDGARIQLIYNRSAAPRVRELVRREQQCCPFFAFDVRDEADAVILVIDAPDGVGADALLAPYITSRQ